MAMTFKQFQSRAAKARASKLSPNRRAEIASMGGKAKARNHAAQAEGKNKLKYILLAGK